MVRNGETPLQSHPPACRVRAEGEEMIGRNIPTFLAILACVLLATALTAWLSNEGNRVLPAGGLKAKGK